MSHLFRKWDSSVKNLEKSFLLMKKTVRWGWVGYLLEFTYWIGVPVYKVVSS